MLRQATVVRPDARFLQATRQGERRERGEEKKTGEKGPTRARLTVIPGPWGPPAQWEPKGEPHGTYTKGLLHQTPLSW